jgi:opacity protein-like surface antigen
MKLKSLCLAALIACGMSAGQAAAYSPYTCTLRHIGTNPVGLGQSYGYALRISFVDFGPLPPPSYKPFQVVFHGTKNGVPDTGSGQYLWNAAGNYTEQLMTYNPGGVAGNYVRYALIYRDGHFICSTNSVYQTLL